jgi:outer membrane protein OmpA-like peptidoglycan-associated protein
MRTFSIVLALACAGTASLVSVAAHAQATVDPRALEPLQAPATAQEQASPQTNAQPAKPAGTHHKRTAHPVAPHSPAAPPASGQQSSASPSAGKPAAAVHPVAPAAQPVPPPAPGQPSTLTPPPKPAAGTHLAAPAPPQVRVPLGPPPGPVLPPPLIVPIRPPAPPAPAPVAADAPGAAAPIPDGLRVTFGEGRADLNPGTETALRTLAHRAPAETSFTVAAFAPGAPEDPSTPRRLSLSRALTVRSVLMAEGIPSVRVYVKAFGASHGVEDGPADRVDVTLASANPQAPTSQARPPQ